MANLVGESLELRDKILAGVNLVSLIGDIVTKSQHIAGNLLKTIMWVLCNIARSKHLHVNTANEIITIVQNGLHVESYDIRSDCLWALFYCCENNDSNAYFLL